MAQNSANIQLGHLLLNGLRSNKDGICQIDAGTGEEETSASVLKRTIRTFHCFRKLGLKPGDVMSLAGINHLDIHIPYYAAVMAGVTVAAVDPLYKYSEIKSMFEKVEPKIVFCQQSSYSDNYRAVDELKLNNTMIVTFDGDEKNFQKFLEDYGQDEDPNVFQLNEFDPKKTLLWLVSTSGTTGIQKFAMFYHEPLVAVCLSRHFIDVMTTMKGECALSLSPVQWISSFFFNIIFPIIGITKVQSSLPSTTDHVIDIINKYKPVTTLTSPAIIGQILKSPRHCDFTCFKSISLTGSKVHNDIIIELRSRAGPKCMVSEAYGQTETLGPALGSAPEGPLGTCGKPLAYKQVKLVDPDTEEVITEPYKTGELWIKTPPNLTFAGYYNMPEETAKAHSPDGYYKTGDLLYRDENNYYFYVDRLKMLIKYKNHHIIPVELEEVIRQHPAVDDVAVTSIADSEAGELAVACVVRKHGAQLTADDVRKIVADNLADVKLVRGGVIFLDALPRTSTDKIARSKLKDIVKTAKRE